MSCDIFTLQHLLKISPPRSSSYGLPQTRKRVYFLMVSKGVMDEAVLESAWHMSGKCWNPLRWSPSPTSFQGRLVGTTLSIDLVPECQICSNPWFEAAHQLTRFGWPLATSDVWFSLRIASVILRIASVILYIPSRNFQNWFEPYKSHERL